MVHNDIKENKRIEWIDTAKGFCILLVVLQHCAQFLQVSYPLQNFFLTFRMPLYFILSGLFFKTYEGFGGFAKRKINKLLIPYTFFFIVTSILIPVIVYHFSGYKIWFYSDYGVNGLRFIFSEQIICNPSIWFLYCLFVVNIIFYVIHIICKNDLIILTLSLFIGAIGIGLSVFQINIPYFIDSALSATPFFCFGWWLRKKTNYLQNKSFSRLIGIKRIAYIIVSALLLIGIAFFIYKYNHGKLSIRSNSYGDVLGILEFYPYGILGTMLVLQISKTLGTIPIISYLGRYSIIVLCTHVYILQFSSELLDNIQLKFRLPLLFLMTAIICLPIVHLFKKYLGHFTAQKNIIKI